MIGSRLMTLISLLGLTCVLGAAPVEADAIANFPVGCGNTNIIYEAADGQPRSSYLQTAHHVGTRATQSQNSKERRLWLCAVSLRVEMRSVSSR